MDRGQLSTTVFEAGLGVLFVVAIVAGFSIGVPSGDATGPQFDDYASDVATVLANEPPHSHDESWLPDATESPDAFERERDGLDARITSLLADHLLYRLETPHGVVGYPRPTGVATGSASVSIENGEVRVWIWTV